jgi:hypothetical protein
MSLKCCDVIKRTLFGNHGLLLISRVILVQISLVLGEIQLLEVCNAYHGDAHQSRSSPAPG